MLLLYHVMRFSCLKRERNRSGHQLVAIRMPWFYQAPAPIAGAAPKNRRSRRENLQAMHSAREGYEGSPPRVPPA